MKRPLVYAMVLCMLLHLSASCQSNQSINNFTINGTAFDNTRLVSLRMNGKSLCKARVKEGSFVLNGHSDSVCIAYFKDNNYIALPVVLEPDMEVTLDEPNNLVSGTTLNDQLYRYVKAWSDWYIETCRVIDSLDNNGVPVEQREELPEVKHINAMRLRAMDTIAWDVYHDNRNNLVGSYVFYELISYAETNDDFYNGGEHSLFDRLMTEYEHAAPIVKDDKDIRSIIERLQIQMSVKAGNPFKDFPAVTYPDRKPTTLGAEIAGKVAVIDFWASWCGPCRREISEDLIPLYEKYADRGLVVLGVDVDDSFSKHEAASQQLGIPYRQIIDTTQNSKMLYGINAIPQVFLIAADGTMLGNFQYGDGKLVPAVEKALGIKTE